MAEEGESPSVEDKKAIIKCSQSEWERFFEVGGTTGIQINIQILYLRRENFD